MTNNLIFEPLMHSICSFLFAIIILLLVFSLAWSFFIIRCIQVVHFYLLLYNLIACFLSYVIVEILCWFVLFSADFYLLDPVSINYYYYYRQGQHTLTTSRSQGQSQGHEGHFRYYGFSRISPTVMIGEWLFSSVKHSNGSVGHLGPCWAIYYQRWQNVADPTSLDVLVLLCAA